MSAPLRHKVLLDEDEMPTRWYNILHDLPTPPPPPLHPGTGQPVGPDDLAGIFPMDLIAQEVTTDQYVDIPQEVQDVYRLWRPSPLYRAHRLEKALGTPAHIYYKYEGVSPAGSHKPNTAVPQAYYNAKAGIRKLTTETGAGQWGTALSFACAQFDLECEIWQVRASYDAKPYRKIMMEIFGGTVHPSPSDLTEAGPHDARQRPRLPRLAGPGHQRGRRDGGPGPHASTTRWARCSTTCCCTRRSSARRPCSSWPRSARAPTSSSAAPAVARTSVASPSRSCARSSRPARARSSAPSSRRRARRSPRAPTPTTSATSPA